MIDKICYQETYGTGDIHNKNWELIDKDICVSADSHGNCEVEICGIIIPRADLDRIVNKCNLVSAVAMIKSEFNLSD